MKQLSMTDFVLKVHNEIEDTYDSEQAMFDYAKFISQPLKKGMFVPCDENDEILEKPDGNQYPESLCNLCALEKKGGYSVNGGFVAGCEGSRCEETKGDYDIIYQQAKDRVIFEGFIVGTFTDSKGNCFEFIENKKLELILYVKDVGSNNWIITDNQLKTIEDLQQFNLEIRYE